MPKLARATKMEKGKKVFASEFYSFRVMRDGKSTFVSTKQSDCKEAKKVMDASLGNLACEKFGRPPLNGPVKKYTLATFIDQKFLPYVRGSEFQPKTKEDYEYRCAKFKAHMRTLPPRR
jgi:hypothetical protein